MITIGLTGNIGCGKSSVARMMAELGATLIDADKVVHEEMAPDRPVWQAIVSNFGDAVLNPDRTIDRAKLAAIVFADKAALALLEAITHPAAKQAVADRIASRDGKLVVVEAVKLVEAGWHHSFDSLWLVTCSPEEQLRRLTIARGMPEAEARARLAAQPPLEAKRNLAFVVIDNSGSPAETFAQIKRGLELELARRRT